MSWNYRVVKEKKFHNEELGHYDNYRIVEVFYDEKGNIKDWCDCCESILDWDNYDDLKGSAEYVLEAFKKPVLIVKGKELIKEEP